MLWELQKALKSLAYLLIDLDANGPLGHIPHNTGPSVVVLVGHALPEEVWYEMNASITSGLHTVHFQANKECGLRTA